MPDDPYSLSDLARLADVTPRTVRYYVALGLLPSPEAAGPATRYGEGHLARLRLIRRLQRDHLPLAEIRIRLERMADDEIIATVSALDAREPDPSQDPGDTLAFVRSLMQQSGIRPSVADRGPAPDVAVRQMATAESLDGAWAKAAAALPPASSGLAAPPPALSAPAASGRESGSATSPRPGPDRTTWERLVITPDVELHVRRPLDRTTNKRVDQLERIARELFEDH
jgi:DNA-binding transcriptional MerR regulator